ncbi:MAG: FMN-binding protein [Oscillospiraceae bacterium]|nr:FMN-binding protein [Oscillospiraceae bacterium]
MNNVKQEFVMPIAVLTAICLVITAALAFTEQATTPIIAAAEKASAEAARMEVLPGADAFEQVSNDGMPDGVVEVYNATNGAGTVVIAEGKGYGGTMKIIVGIGADGKITGTKTLGHSETAGLGSKTAEEPFQSQFPGQDSSLSGVSAIGGASISSKCFIGMVEKAFIAQTVAQGGSFENPLGLDDAKLAKYYPGATFTEVAGGIKCGDAGNVVFATQPSFGGDMVVAVLFDGADNVIGVVVDKCTDTEGLGLKVIEDDFTSQFVGKTNTDGVDNIAGATISSEAFKSAFNSAIAGLSAVKGA